MKARIAHFFRETPIFFIGTVLVIAVTFRVGIGAVKGASASADTLAEAPALHTPVASTPAKTPSAPAVAVPVVQAEPAPVAPPAMPEPQKPQAKRKTPRVHGKR